MKRLAKLVLIGCVVGASFWIVRMSVVEYGPRLTTRTVAAPVAREASLKFDDLWVRWFEVVLREPRSARWKVVRTWESAEMNLGGEIVDAAVQQIRLTGRNGFGGQSRSEAWVAVPEGRAPWFRLNDGAWTRLSTWEGR